MNHPKLYFSVFMVAGMLSYAVALILFSINLSIINEGTTGDCYASDVHLQAAFPSIKYD